MTSNVSPEIVKRSMNSIVGEAVQMSSPVIARSEVRTEIVFDPAKPMVSANPAQLLQVMLNLLQNARGEIGPLVIGRDHLDSGSVASPNRETEKMRDGSDAVSDWPLLNALLNTASGATW